MSATQQMGVFEASRLRGGASRSLIILFRYMPLDPAYKAGLARHETGQMINLISTVIHEQSF
jgi:hypothetical protein